MKNLKMFPAAVAMIVVSLIAGCSDLLTSSGETENRISTKRSGEEVVSTQESFSVSRFLRVQIRLKPNRSYTFDEAVTGFDEITSVNIENLSLDPNIDQDRSGCQDIAVYETYKGEVFSCHSEKINAKQITIENTGSRMLDLDVALRGFTKKYDDLE